jgi:WD40 repeat protein
VDPPECDWSEAFFSPDGSCLVTWSASGNGILWSAHGKTLQQFSAASCSEVVFSRDLRHMAIAAGTTARVFDTRSGTELIGLPHATRVRRLAFSPDGRLLATICGETFQNPHLLRLWEWRFDDIRSNLCSRLTRSLTLDEKNRFFPKEHPN